VESEQHRHRRERRADEDRPRVLSPGADDRQRDGGEPRHQRGQPDAGEMDVPAELHLLPREEVQRGKRQRSEGAAEGKQRNCLEGGPPQPHVFRMIGRMPSVNLPQMGEVHEE
jgi:hypothetical protein